MRKKYYSLNVWFREAALQPIEQEGRHKPCGVFSCTNGI